MARWQCFGVLDCNQISCLARKQIYSRSCLWHLCVCLIHRNMSDNTQFRCLKYVTLIPSIWLLITNRYTPGLVCVASRPTTGIAQMPGLRARWHCFGFVLDCKQISCRCTQNSFSCLLTVSLSTQLTAMSADTADPLFLGCSDWYTRFLGDRAIW